MSKRGDQFLRSYLFEVAACLLVRVQRLDAESLLGRHHRQTASIRLDHVLSKTLNPRRASAAAVPNPNSILNK
ncbi:hypothetical protein CTJ15_03905 (plasmid) [Roseomonas sp. FDAARGOS_362]|nr:hypothetical protein CTJ15_03905 [Roseomonas sp. FDAARGOS_362]